MAAREGLFPKQPTARSKRTGAGAQEDRPIDGDGLYKDMTGPAVGGIARGRLISAKKVTVPNSVGVFGRIGSWFKRFFG